MVLPQEPIVLSPSTEVVLYHIGDCRTFVNRVLHGLQVCALTLAGHAPRNGFVYTIGVWLGPRLARVCLTAVVDVRLRRTSANAYVRSYT